MEGTQKPWWIRSVCCCLGFAKPFSYIVPALKILGNYSADNFVMKLNMSGWQRLSCLIFIFFFVSVCSLWFCDWLQGQDEGTMQFYSPPGPCKKVVNFTGDQTPIALSSLLLFPLSLLPWIYRSSPLYMLAIHIFAPTNKLMCPTLLVFFYFVFLSTYLFRLKCLPFTNSLT